jgi:hypothetical protein
MAAVQRLCGIFAWSQGCPGTTRKLLMHRHPTPLPALCHTLGVGHAPRGTVRRSCGLAGSAFPPAAQLPPAPFPLLTRTPGACQCRCHCSCCCCWQRAPGNRVPSLSRPLPHVISGCAQNHMRLLASSVATRMNRSGSHHLRLSTTSAPAHNACGCLHHLRLLTPSVAAPHC